MPDVASLLARASSAAFDEGIFRVTLTADEIGIIKDYIAANDPLGLAEATSFFADVLSGSDNEALLDVPFTSNPAGSAKPFRNGRFSNGDHPVFYGAIERETAADEYAYHAPKYFDPAMGNVVEIHIHLLRCRFRGSVKDLRALATDFPELIGDDYSFCQVVGATARAESLQGLLAPSARRTGGSNVPTFERPALSEPESVAKVRCVVDAVARSANCTLIP